MQLLEVKNDIAKIVYSPAENHLLPADFLLVEDVNQKLIAQIINISTTDNTNNIADIRLALSIDKDDNLSYYNGYIPSKSSNVLYINPDEIIELIKGAGETLYFGNLSNHSECFVKPSTSFVDDKVYIQSDRDDKTKTVVQNLVSELYQKKKKVVLLDFDGRYNSIYNVPKLKISDSFKLPLNIEAFNTILEYDTVDCPIEDKAVIQSIVLELREYLNTLENKFLPFTLFRNVVDNEFMANPISGLMLLRNKLWLYAQESIFAESKSQFDLINNILDKQDVLVIDASNLEEKWYKFAIQTLMGLIEKKCYFVLSLNDVPMDKKSILAIYNNLNITPIISTSFDSDYRQLLKSLCKNQILFKPSYLVNDEDAYNSLLPKINSGEFILYGESTLYLPLILELQPFDSSTSEEVIQNEIKKDVDKLLSSPKKNIPPDVSMVTDVSNEKEEKMVTYEDSVDDDFVDSDLDFLDEQDNDELPSTIEEIRQTKTVEQPKDDEYDIFVPMSVRESMMKESLMNDMASGQSSLQSDFSEIEEIPENSSDTLTLIDDSELVSSEVREQNINEQSFDVEDIFNEVENSSLQNLDEENSQEFLEFENVEQPKKTEQPKKSLIDDITNINDLLDLEDGELTSLSSKKSSISNFDEVTEIQDIEFVEQDVGDVLSSIDDFVSIDNEELSQDQNITVELDDLIDDIKDVDKSDESIVDSNTVDSANNVQTSSSDADDGLDVDFESKVESTEKSTPPPPVNEKISVKQTEKLPIYETDIPDKQEEIPFKVGDRVYHPKHGNGVIEGFANYSNKIMFCQIEFDDVGRRILDPRIAGIEKIS